MKSINKVLTLLLATTIISSITGCSSSPNKQEGPSAEELAEQKTIHDIDVLLEDFPPPSLVPFTLKSIGVEFSEELINGTDKVDAYKENIDKMSLNMGVYASDISYLAAYGQEDLCIEYLQTAHKLAESLGDSAIYGKYDLNEFKGHIANENDEEITKLLSKLFMETSVQMEQDHHLTMAALALTGSFIEGLYQAIITIENFPDTKENEKLLEPVAKIVMGEEQPLREIIEVLKDIPFDDTISAMIAELSILDTLYKGDLATIQEKMENDPNFIVSRRDMRDIGLEVKRIRKLIVE